MKTIPLILLGCGGVGRQLIQHIVSCRSLHADQGVRLRVLGVSDSKTLLAVSNVSTAELDDGSLLEICRVKSRGSSFTALAGFGEFQVFTDLEVIRKVLDSAMLLGRSAGLALVDCSASSDTLKVLNQVVDLDCCVVLANKKPLTAALEDYDKLVSNPRCVRYESTVGAGLPVIASLNRIISSGDPINNVVGSLSGTLGYVMSEIEEGKPFSEVVKVAKALGYTEPDPRDDLSGMDVARKGLIVARLLGWRINLDNIKENMFLTYKSLAD
uniref:Homoserine dehydrogenase n=1 Tax=Kalanchoe fedtschenkoi TaxID=63787 RepID=A0A7N0RIG2_KALFE